MSESQNDADKQDQRPSKMSAIILLADIADTTWRMFVPPIIGALLGWWADSSWGTFPWFSFIGLAIGCTATAFFIKALLKRVNNV
ncbi:MAG: AtpZ/AtpI family protein [bacterium]|nr:AtpZ/AtpI family protein [bacterium]MDN5835417.1 AtpZ/AtpI family protein [bacterium]